MAFRKSAGLLNFMNQFGSLAQALQGGRIEIYSGSQPASADAAVTGTLLCTITASSGALTNEVLASGTVTLSGSSGSVDTITVNSVEVMGASVPFNSTLTQTAADCAAQINRFRSNPKYMATSSGAVITIKALPGTGTDPNGFVVAKTLTTMTASVANLSGGVAAVNGLKFDNSLAGVLSKLSTQTWSGVNAATGAAGWFRAYGSVADAGGLDSTSLAIRLDGSVSTSGADMNLTSTAFSATATTSLNAWTHTMT